MELKELLVQLSRKGFVFKMSRNNWAYNYEVSKADRTAGGQMTIVTNADETPWNLYWDNPTGSMRYETYQDVYNYLVLGECNGKWRSYGGGY